MTDETAQPLREETDAIARIARTKDGALLHRWLRRVLETVYDTPDSGALLSHNGRRTLARDLMRQMADGIEAQTSGGRTELADQPILGTGAKPVAVARSRGTGRRVDAGTRVPGWDEPDDAA